MFDEKAVKLEKRFSGVKKLNQDELCGDGTAYLDAFEILYIPTPFNLEKSYTRYINGVDGYNRRNIPDFVKELPNGCEAVKIDLKTLTIKI